MTRSNTSPEAGGDFTRLWSACTCVCSGVAQPWRISFDGCVMDWPLWPPTTMCASDVKEVAPESPILLTQCKGCAQSVVLVARSRDPWSGRKLAPPPKRRKPTKSIAFREGGGDPRFANARFSVYLTSLCSYHMIPHLVPPSSPWHAFF